MRISDIITPEAIVMGVRFDDKAHALRFAAASLGARSGHDPVLIRDALAAREELGSTGIGHGSALPHVRFSGLDRPYGLLCVLAKPIPFKSIDDDPVDLICTLISPLIAQSRTEEPLCHLAAISRILRDGQKAAALREAKTSREIHGIIANSSTTADLFVS